MRMESLRDLTKDELLQKREEIKQELFTLQMRKGVRELDNPLKLRTLRRAIAQIETLAPELLDHELPTLQAHFLFHVPRKADAQDVDRILTQARKTVLHEDRMGTRKIVDQTGSVLDQADSKKQ